MKKILTLTSFMAVATISAYAAPACVTTPPNNNLIAGAPNVLTALPLTDTYVPCSAGPLTFQNVSYNLDLGSFAGGTATIPVIQIAPVGTEQVLTINPNLAANSDLLLEYQIVGNGINDVSLSFNGTGTGFTNEVVCKVFFSAATGGACSGSNLLGTLNVTSSLTTAATLNFAPQPEIWVFKDIASGNAPYSEVFQDYSTVVPEPATLSLMGASLLGLGLFGRRRLRK